jgi:hypothetical protein
MQDAAAISYADLSLTNAGLVYLNSQALRPCMYAGRQFFVVGTPDEAHFYDATQILRALQGSASELDLPLPEPIEVPVMAEFDDAESRFLREFMLGAATNYLKTTIREERISLILDKAKSLGIVIQQASATKLLAADVREQTAAALRARALNDKAQDLVTDYVAAQEEVPEEVVCGVVRKASPKVYERIARNAGGYSPSTTRVKWPFNTMQVGDEIYIDAKLARRAQTAVHVYAARMGRRFATTTNKVTKILHVLRLEDRAE